MRLPSVNRLAQRFTDAPPWFRVFAQQLNDLLKEMYAGLDKNITLSENIRCQEIVQYTFQTPSDYVATNNFTPIIVKKKYRQPITHVMLTHIYETNAPGNVVGTATVSPSISGGWRDDGDSVVISFITGLADSTAYTCSILVF